MLVVIVVVDFENLMIVVLVVDVMCAGIGVAAISVCPKRM